MLRASQYLPQYNQAVGTTESYRGTDHTVAKMVQLVNGPRGERSIPVRRHTEQIITHVRPKDYVSEYIAICRWWGNAGRYTRDPLHVEMLRDPERLVADALAGKLAMDCFPEDTLLLKDDYSLTPISSIEPGSRIWGCEGWSDVEEVWAKGSLPVDAIGLNTGTTMHLTSDHKVYVVLPSGGVERVRVADLEPEMVLLSPERIDFGSGGGDRLGQRLHPKWHPVKVRWVERNVVERECYDIRTSDHKVYLPAHDVTVSNCDEYAIAIGTGCLVVGGRIQFVTVGFRPRRAGEPKIHTHVFVRAQDPKTKRWWVLDPVAGRRTDNMLKRIKQYTVFEVD